MSELDSIPESRPQVVNTRFLQLLRWAGFIEGTSTLILFGIAMPLKYLAEIPMAVRIVGSVHGALFVGLAAILMLGIKKVPISPHVAFVGLAAAVVPFGPFVYDGWLVRHAKT